MGEFVAKLPPDYMMNFMDLLFELVDAPAGRKLSERANKLLPEGLRDEGEEGQQDPAQLQAKLQEAARTAPATHGSLQGGQALWKTPVRFNLLLRPG